MAEMDCNEAAVLITALVDGELELDDLGRVQSHLARCEDCASRRRLEERLKAFLHERLARVATPADLQDRIRRALADLDDGPGPAPEGGQAGPGASPTGPQVRVRVRTGPDPARRTRPRWVPLAILLGLMVAMVVLLVVMEAGGPVQPGDDVLQPLSEVHWAATQAGIFQVRTRNAEELTAWLQPRTGPYARVPELDNLGMTATGGRVVRLGRTKMAMALYRDYTAHTPDITLLQAGTDFTWPPEAGTPESIGGLEVRMTRFRGMELAALERDGVTCVLISFREPEGMRSLVAAFIAAMDRPAEAGTG